MILPSHHFLSDICNLFLCKEEQKVESHKDNISQLGRRQKDAEHNVNKKPETLKCYFCQAKSVLKASPFTDFLC